MTARSDHPARASVGSTRRAVGWRCFPGACGSTNPWMSGFAVSARKARSSSIACRTNLIWRESSLVPCGSPAAEDWCSCSRTKVAHPASSAASMQSGASERCELLMEPEPTRGFLGSSPRVTSSGPLRGGWGRKATPETRTGPARPSVQGASCAGHRLRSQTTSTRMPSQPSMSPTLARPMRANGEKSRGIEPVVSLNGRRKSLVARVL